jgi:hypothetical protein
MRKLKIAAEDGDKHALLSFFMNRGDLCQKLR